jgi:hypothetical protein
MAVISTYLYLYDVLVSLSLHPFISVPVVAKHILKENIYEVSEMPAVTIANHLANQERESERPRGRRLGCTKENITYEYRRRSEKSSTVHIESCLLKEFAVTVYLSEYFSWDGRACTCVSSASGASWDTQSI